jgi:hypothetical protein
MEINRVHGSELDGSEIDESELDGSDPTSMPFML